MPDYVMTEEPLQFGGEGRLFGILTVPSAPSCNLEELPVFVFLSAGLLHRVGPYRLHVRLVRELAKMGFTSLRVDLAGTGDSPPRLGLTNQQSVAADFDEILKILDSRLGRLPLVLAGLCTGADNAIMIALNEPRVVGLLLFDPFCFPDRGFRLRSVFARYTNPARQIAWLKRRAKALTRVLRKEQENLILIDGLAFRDLPTREQMRAAIEVMSARNGRVMSIFTQYALRYYNHAGQLGRVLGINGYLQFCDEMFLPEVDHTYRLELHRRRVIEAIKRWAACYMDSRKSVQPDPLAPYDRPVLRPVLQADETIGLRQL